MRTSTAVKVYELKNHLPIPEVYKLMGKGCVPTFQPTLFLTVSLSPELCLINASGKNKLYFQAPAVEPYAVSSTIVRDHA
jgi:hypothetical protein